MAQVRSSCKKVPLEENLSSDKQIISFKGGISLKTIIQRNPINGNIKCECF